MRISLITIKKFLIIILVLLFVGFITIRSKINNLDNLGKHYGNYWINYKIDNEKDFNKEYSFIYEVLAAESLSKQVHIKEFEYTYTSNGFIDTGKSYIRIWLEVPNDKALIEETLEQLNEPLSNNGKFYIKDQEYVVEEQMQRIFAKTDRVTIIEVLRLVDSRIDRDSLPNGIEVSYSPNNARNSATGDIYNIYMEQQQFKNMLIDLFRILFIIILIDIGLLISIFMYQRELKKIRLKN